MIHSCARAKRRPYRAIDFPMGKFKELLIWAILSLVGNLFATQAWGNSRLLGSGLLVPKDSSWLGADGAISVPLAENLRLWLFGDTWLRSGDGSLKMVSNSMGIQEGECSDAFQPLLGEGTSAALQPPEKKQGWLWPVGGISLEEGLFLVFHRMERRGPGPWDFNVLGSELLRISNPRAPPSQWELLRVNLPWPGEDFLVASSPLRYGNYILLFATRPDGGSRRLFLARIHKTRFVSLGVQAGWELWAARETWSPCLQAAQPLFDGVGTELTISTDPQGHGWTCLYSPGGISPQMVLRRASAPQGPWGDAQPLYTCPEAASQTFYCYGAKLHPECSSSGLWITYSVNARDGGFPGTGIARPRWLLLEAP